MKKGRRSSRLALALLLAPLGAWAQATPVAGPPPATSASQEAGEPYIIGGDVSTPERIRGADPKYPADALITGVSGRVLISLWVEKDGTVSHLAVVQGLGHGLDEAALRAVSHWVFKPAMKDGKPVTVEARISVRFVIES